MDNAPLFDAPDQFDTERIRLADIDGSGPSDLIYLGRDGVRVYFNQSGNGWSAPRTACAVHPDIDARHRRHGDRPFGQRHGLPGLVARRCRGDAGRQCATST